MSILKKVLIIILSLVTSIIWFISLWEDSLDAVLWQWSEAWDYQIINQEQKVNDLTSNNESSFVTRASKLLLKITVIIGIIVALVWWIRFLLSFWDDSKAKKTRDSLIISIVWFIIAFWSWVILQIILSIWPSIIQWTWG